jgi:hypothetical protein
VVFFLIPVLVIIGSIIIDVAVEQITGQDIMQHVTKGVDSLFGSDLHGMYTHGFKEPVEGFFESLFSKSPGGAAGEAYDRFVEFLETLYDGLLSVYESFVEITDRIIYMESLILILLLSVAVFGILVVISIRRTDKMLGGGK